MQLCSLLVQSFPFSGVPVYPVKHLQSVIVMLCEFEWPELAGQGVHCLAKPLKSLYVDGGQAEKRENPKIKR